MLTYPHHDILVRIRALTKLIGIRIHIRLWILLFSSLSFKMPKKFSAYYRYFLKVPYI